MSKHSHASHGHKHHGESGQGTPTATGESPLQPSAGTGDSPPDTVSQAAQTEGSTPEAAVSPEQKIKELETELANTAAQLADAKDQFLRKAADFENFRKRMNREKQDAIDFANQSLLLDLIPILDDFDRALDAAKTVVEQPAENGLYEGVEMIAKRLSSTLESKWGLKSYSSAGELFDPNRHEALMMEKSADVAEQTVQMDLLKGYALKDRVIRSAKVKVLVPENNNA